MARGTKPAPTLLQQRAIEGMKAVIVGKDNKSLVQVLQDVGYSPESARQWTNIMAGIRPHLQPTLDWLELHRARVQQRMDETIDKADYADLARSLDIVTKNLQLLSGRATANIAVSTGRRQELDKLIDN
jgi:hypothetical protein